MSRTGVYTRSKPPWNKGRKTGPNPAISAALKDRPLSPEHRTNISVSIRRLYQEDPNYRLTQLRAHSKNPNGARGLREHWTHERVERGFPPWLSAQNKINGRTYFNVCMLWPLSRVWVRRSAAVLTAVYGPPEADDHEPHHLNNDSRDDRPENLVWLPHAEHQLVSQLKDRARAHSIEAEWRARLEARGGRPVTLNELLTLPMPESYCS